MRNDASTEMCWDALNSGLEAFACRLGLRCLPGCLVGPQRNLLHLQTLNSDDLYEYHVLRPLFTRLAQRNHSLRPRAHDFVLPRKDDKNYIPRILYRLRNSVVKSEQQHLADNWSYQFIPIF